MKKLIYLIPLSFFAFACGQTVTTTENPATDSTTTADTPISAESSELDLIDNENNATILASGEEVNKAIIPLKDGDSTINLYASSTQDHRFFGYAEPDTKSERLLLISVFTNDVDGNPFGCKLGAYYDTSELTIKYTDTTGDFIKALTSDENGNPVIVYFERRWIEFEL